MSVEFYILAAVIVSLVGGFALGFYYRGRRDPLGDIESRLENTFKAVASTALSQSTTELLKLSEDKFKTLVREGDLHLESKKKLIDASLQDMGETLKGLVEGLATSKEQTERLRSTTEGLQRLLDNPQKRGQWGESRAEDILRAVGLEKGIHYKTQMRMDSEKRPDYTFILPEAQTVNLDVKFPITHYRRYVNANSKEEAESAKKQFLTDVKNHLRSVVSKEYINPAEGTLDYVMVFIPIESIYAFIHQNDPTLLDYALENHIVLCSPITLYAVVSMVRQAAENISIQKEIGEIVRHLQEFHKQWAKYVKEMEKMGGAIDRAKEKYNSLVTTRTGQLEKPLNKILKLQEGRQEELLRD